MQNRTVKNAAWIIGCRIIQAVLGLAVTMISARYLGPSGYGLINYAASIVAFFVPVMQLGMNATLVQEIVDHPEQEGETLGTSLMMTLVSSFACILGVATFTMIANRGETQTIVVCTLYSFLLVFQSLEMIQYWFQAKLLSRYTSVTILIAYVFVSAYRITLLVTGSNIYWYAISQAIDLAMIAFTLLTIYRKLGNQKLRFSFAKAKLLFANSKYYILSGLMVTVFAQTDRVMLKLMINEDAVGYYSAAVSCATLTAFVFVAIIDSARPTILEGKNVSAELFEKRLKTLYAIIILLALAQSVVICIFAKFAIQVLYGSQYTESISALRIIVWFTTFSYLGATRDIWILSEGKQKYLLGVNLCGALANVVLNAILIPLYGVNGAAIASLITQIFTNVIMGCILKPIRENNRIMLASLHPKFIMEQAKDFILKELK